MFKSFDIVQLAYFSFFAYNFSVISKILLSSSMSRSFFPMFSSSSLITVSHTTFKSLIFQVNFEYGIRQGSSFILYHEDIQCSPYHLLKRLSFPYCVLGTLVKNQLTIYAWVYFWVLHSFPLVCVSVFMSTSQCIDYHGR